MLVSLDLPQGEALEWLCGWRSSSIRLRTPWRRTAREGVGPGLTREEASCPSPDPAASAHWHTAAVGSWKTLHNCRICAAADLPNHDGTAAPNGGSARGYLPVFAWLADAVMVQRASGCPYVCASAPSG
jgi:hypothetical protein